MSKARSAIIELFLAGNQQCEIVRLLRVPKQTVNKAIKRYQELGTLRHTVCKNQSLCSRRGH